MDPQTTNNGVVVHGRSLSPGSKAAYLENLQGNEGWEYYLEEFDAAVHRNLDALILDPQTDAAERVLLVNVRHYIRGALSPSTVIKGAVGRLKNAKGR